MGNPDSSLFTTLAIQPPTLPQITQTGLELLHPALSKRIHFNSFKNISEPVTPLLYQDKNYLANHLTVFRWKLPVLSDKESK